MVAAGDDPAALTQVMRTQLAASVAAAADVPVSGVTLRVVAASLLLIFDVAVDTAAASNGLAASLAARMATPEAATRLVSVDGVTVIATPATRALVETVLAPSPSPPPPPEVAATPPPPPTGDDEDDIADDESLVSTGGGSDAGAIAGSVLGGLAAVMLLGAVAFVYQRRVAAQRSPEQLAQSITDGHASGGGADKKLSVVAVHLDRDTALPQPPDFPDEKPTTEGAAPPQSLPALLAACGLEHHRSAFEAERYTLENLLSVMKQGDEAAIRDLRELKLNLEECRKFITQLKKTSWV